VTDAVFELDGDVLVPTVLARGPWDPTAMHGGPPAALLARAVESVAGPDGVELPVARLTVELLRPVPLEPLAVTTAVLRTGRRMQVVDVSLTLAGTGTEVVRGRALRIRSAPVPLPYEDPLRGPLLVPDGPPGSPDGLERGAPLLESDEAFHRDAIDLRFVEGAWDEPGPVAFWGRLLVPLVAGEELTPLQRTMALSDMGNGVSGVVGFDTHVFINPELSVHLWRYPAGEWIAFRSRSHLGAHGVGLAESAIYDRSSRLGAAAQSLFIDVR
jgi:Acyl-CoA thioesterase N-terminal domain/Acyl-CoA thioesterase C-terminal domain